MLVLEVVVRDWVVREATGSDQNNVGEMQITDGEKSFDERNTRITSSHDHNSGVLHDLCFRQDSSSAEAQCKGWLLFIKRISVAAIYSVFDVFVMLLLSIFGDKSLVIPFSIQEVWESSASHVNEIVENWRNDCLIVDLKVHACLLSQPQQLFQDDSCRFFKDWVDTRVNQASVALAVLLGNQDLILDVEVRNVVLKVDILRKYESSYDLVEDFGYEAVVCACWIYSTFVEGLIHVFGFVKWRDQLLRSLKVSI